MGSDRWKRAKKFHRCDSARNAELCAPERLFVPHVLDGLLATLRPLAVKKQLDLVVVSDTALTFLFADAGKLKQILYNLVSNAVKFTPPSGRVSLGASRSGDVLTIGVSDTGIGIKREDQERIFQAFTQVDASYAWSPRERKRLGPDRIRRHERAWTPATVCLNPRCHITRGRDRAGQVDSTVR